jgi:hypothetical protein
MKYLKKYKIFESYFNEDIINELDDILLELKDLGYFVDITEMKGSGVFNPAKIRVFIGGIAGSNFVYDDVKEVFERMTDYMESEDFTISNLLYSTPEEPASHFSINLTDYKNGTLKGFDKEIDILHHLEISFTSNWLLSLIP